MDISFDSASDFSDQVFKRVTYQKQQINRKTFNTCTFTNCSFMEAAFTNCRFVDCTFKECDLRMMTVKGSAFTNTQFEKSKVIGMNWAEGTWAKSGLLNSIGFSECDISYCTFIGLNLRKIKIIQCTAKDTDFAEADLTEADCTYTDFTESRFLHTDLTGADFRHATNYSISPLLNKLKKAKFSLPEAVALLYGLDIVIEQ